jgi:hypothetical protein
VIKSEVNIKSLEKTAVLFSPHPPLTAIKLRDIGYRFWGEGFSLHMVKIKKQAKACAPNIDYFCTFFKKLFC